MAGRGFFAAALKKFHDLPLCCAVQFPGDFLAMNTDTHNLSQIGSLPSRSSLTWGLLTLWLVYSATALGWHLANDPFLSQYVCKVR
jgi:hypothetical protein